MLSELTNLEILNNKNRFPFFLSDIDECSSNPCQNGGSCTDQVDGFICTCAAGYTGNACEIGMCDLFKIGQVK